jgi:helix-turn-helix protein
VAERAVIGSRRVVGHEDTARAFNMNATCARDLMFVIFRDDAPDRSIVTTNVQVMGDGHGERGEQNEPLLSSGEVARRIGVAPATISAWVRQGRLEPTVTTMGGRYRWRWSDVKRQMRE